jgi:molecular chaperone GrpE
VREEEAAQGQREDQGTEEFQEDPGGVESHSGEEAPSTDEEQLRRELEDTRDRLMRLAAEFENFKKRMEREKARMLKYSGESVLRELLSTLDNLDRAIAQGNAAADDDSRKLEAMLQGLDLTRKGLVATLDRAGVVPMESVGLEFNPDEQDALSLQASSEVPANHILQEFAKGYRFKDKVLRHAQVVVSSGPVKDANGAA